MEANYILRLINSPLKGCEFFLHRKKTLFIVSSDSTLVNFDEPLELPEDTIYIPLEYGGVNFEVLINESDLLLRELSDSNVNVRDIKFNVPIKIGELVIALRTNDTLWDFNALSRNKIYEEKNKNKKLLCCFVALLLCCFVAFLLFFNTSGKNGIQELMDSLGEKNQFKILQGRDNVVYVISKNENDSEENTIIINNTLSQSDYGVDFKVIKREEENKKLSLWLTKNYPELAYYRLYLNDEGRVIFLGSIQRTILNKDETKKINDEIMDLLPYSKSVDFVFKDDLFALNQAENGLKSQYLPYNLIKSDDYITFKINAFMNDSQIFHLREFIDDYKKKWGDNYIRFNITLSDDILKGLNYLSNDYIKINSNHWYFPNTF